MQTKVKKSKVVIVKGKSKIAKKAAPKKGKAKPVKKAQAFIHKDFATVKKYVPKLQKSDLEKINAAVKNSSQDIRLARQSCSGVKLMNLHYAGDLKKFRGKEMVVLSATKSVLHTVNASDRKLLTVMGYLTGKDSVDVKKFYTDGKIVSKRKALVLKIK